MRKSPRDPTAKKVYSQGQGKQLNPPTDGKNTHTHTHACAWPVTIPTSLVFIHAINLGLASHNINLHVYIIKQRVFTYTPITSSQNPFDWPFN